MQAQDSAPMPQNPDDRGAFLTAGESWERIQRKRAEDELKRAEGLIEEVRRLLADRDLATEMKNACICEAIDNNERVSPEIDERITDVRFAHPADGVHTTKIDLATALRMAEDGGRVEVYLSDHKCWFTLVEGPGWRINTLRAVIHADLRERLLSDEAVDEAADQLNELPEAMGAFTEAQTAIHAALDSIDLGGS